MVFDDYNNIASCRRMVSIETEVRTLIFAKYLFVIYSMMITLCNLKI